MHVIDRTDKFTLVGADARRGKLTLFAAEEREPGVLARVGLRVFDLDEALAALPAGLPSSDGRRGHARPRRAAARARRGGRGVAYDLDHVAFLVPIPRRRSRVSPSSASTSTGACSPATRRSCSSPATRATERPLSTTWAARRVRRRPHRGGGAPGSRDRRRRRCGEHLRSVRLGPDRIKLEYVEHKPTFSLT